MKFHFMIHREDNGYWAECVELSGCSTQGRTREDLERNMRSALNLFLDEPEDSGALFPLPLSRAPRGSVLVAVEPRVALAFCIRRARLAMGLTQKRAAQLIGLKGLYSYQRLESAKTANPEFETLVKIKRTFPEIDFDDLIA